MCNKIGIYGDFKLNKTWFKTVPKEYKQFISVVFTKIIKDLKSIIPFEIRSINFIKYVIG